MKIEVRLLDYTDRGQTRVIGKPVEMVPLPAYEDREGPIPATLRLDQDTAQQLVDTLWACGIRPSAAAGSAGAMEAVQKHLADLQTIVFKDVIVIPRK